MIPSATPARWILGGLLGLIWSACQEDLVIDNTDRNFPLALRAVTNGEVIQFSWEPAAISTFESYTLVRSSLPIPPGLSPNSGTALIVFQSDRPDTTTFFEENPPILAETYYKLYVNIGNRFLESDEVKITSDNFLLAGNPYVVRYLPDSNWVLIGNDWTSQVYTLDYNNQKVVGTSNALPFTSLENMAISADIRAGAPELRWWSNNTQALVLRLPDLTLQKSFVPNTNPPFSWLSSRNGAYFTTQYSLESAFSIRNPENFEVIHGEYAPNYYDRRVLALLDPEQNLLLEATPYQLRTFTVDEQTGVVTPVAQTGGSNYPLLLQGITVSHDGQYFISGFNGSVYDRSLAIVAQSPPFSGGIADFAFSRDGAFLYVLTGDPQAFGSVIHKLHFPDMQEVAERRLRGVNPRDIESVDDGVVFVGSNVNGLNMMLIKKLNF